MRFSTDWISDGVNASAEEGATLCNLQIFVNDENACLHFDPGSKATFDRITVPAVHLAEGLSTDWWSIFGGRDREHQILHYRTGFALPDLSFKCDGSTLEVTGSQLSFSNPRVRFWQTGTELLPRDGAESTLAEFIDRVVDQLACHGVVSSEAGVRWSRVSASRSDPDERAFCEAAGALGVDPYLISDSDARIIEAVGALFTEEALIELLAGIRRQKRERARQLLDWVRHQEERFPDESRLPDLADIAEQIRHVAKWQSQERSWAAGYRAARALRAEIVAEPGERLISTEVIAKKLGASDFATTSAIPGVLAFIARNEGHVHIHLRGDEPEEWTVQAKNFAFARAIGDAVCFPDTPRSVVNELRDAERQAAGRAFAAEFLAPIQSVLDMVDSGHDDYEIASSFMVSPQVVARQIESQDRIRQACACDPSSFEGRMEQDHRTRRTS